MNPINKAELSLCVKSILNGFKNKKGWEVEARKLV